MNNELTYEGTISKDYAKKEILKTSLGYFVVFASWMIFILLMVFIFTQDINLDWFLWMLCFIVFLPYLVVLIFSIWYFPKYVRMFKFEIRENNIIIHHGVFNRVKATIPYSRIQNVNITNGMFDRIYDTYTVKVETAGFHAGSGGGQSGPIKPEGYIPGLKDPHIIESKIKEMLLKYSSIPSGLEGDIFKPEELAFDNFISYILSKMREGEKLETSIKQRREGIDLSAAGLAEKVGVTVQTIEYLEEGKYNPSLALAYRIAEVLNCRIEDLFKMI